MIITQISNKIINKINQQQNYKINVIITNLMSNLSTQISYYLRIAIQINKKIGGTKAYQAQLKAKDKFSVLRQQISKKMYYIKNALQRKPVNTMTTLDGIDDQEIKQKLRDVNSCLLRIKDSVDTQRSNTTTKQLKKQIIQKLQQQYRSYQLLIYNKNEEDLTQRGLFSSNKKKDQTLTDMRARLLSDDKDSTIYEPGKRQGNGNNQPNEIQLAQMKVWQQQNQEIDDQVDIIIEKTRTLKDGIKQTGKLLDQTEQKIKQLTQNVDNVNDQLQKSNKKLKGVVQKFRKPHKFCIDIILSIILIGLLVGIIKVAST